MSVLGAVLEEFGEAADEEGESEEGESDMSIKRLSRCTLNPVVFITFVTFGFGRLYPGNK